MQNILMRTTINLDDDVYELASVYAAARGITLGSALGELVRSSSNPLSRSANAPIAVDDKGFPILPSRGRELTPEMAKAASEDEFEWK
jgi:hypothetical protein